MGTSNVENAEQTVKNYQKVIANYQLFIEMKKIVLLFFIFAIGINASAQNKKNVHKVDKITIPGNFLIVKDLDGTFDYYYYEGEMGNHVKNGNFSIKGSATHEEKLRRETNIYNESYSATGKYVDGWLDGTVVIKHRFSRNNEFQEWTLTAHFKNGLPNGEWKTVYKDVGTNNTYAVCHFDDGMLVGKVDLNWNGGNNSDFTDSHIKSMTGEFDTNGNYHGKWILKKTDGNIYEFEFEHGAMYRYIRRDNNGKVANKDDQDPFLIQKAREAAVRYANGEVTVEDLKKQGFKTSLSDSYSDKVKGDVLIDFVRSKKIFIESLYGGQKPLPDSRYFFYAVPSYLQITYLPPVPDYMMNYILSQWNRQAEEYKNHGSYMARKGINLNENLLAYDVFSEKNDGGDKVLYNRIWTTNIDTLIYINYGTWNEYTSADRVEAIPADQNNSMKVYYLTAQQKDTMNAMAQKTQNAALQYILKTLASKYHKVIPDTAYSSSNDARRHYIGYYKEEGGGEFAESFTLFIHKNSAELKDIKKVTTVWDTIVQLKSVLDYSEKQLKNTDETIYSIYKQNNSDDILTDDPDKCKENINRRQKTEINYQCFSSLKNTIQKELNSRIENTMSGKVEFADLQNRYRTFYNAIDFNIYDKAAKTDNERLGASYQTMLKFDTIANLCEAYYSLVDSIDQSVVKFKHINNAFQEYKAGIHLPTDTESLPSLRAIVREIESIQRHINSSDLKALNKQIKSTKDPSEKIRLLKE